MSLEMKVYRDIHSYEAKAMFGLKWRQFGALLVGVPVVFVLFFGITALYLAANGFEYEGVMQVVNPDEETQQLIQDGTTIAMLVSMIAFLPFAVYGWLRPKGLMPEKYIPYWYAYQTTPKELCYGRDDAGDAAGEPVDHRSRRVPARRGAGAAEPVPHARPRGRGPARGGRDAAPRRRRKIDEHAPVPAAPEAAAPEAARKH